MGVASEKFHNQQQFEDTQRIRKKLNCGSILARTVFEAVIPTRTSADI